MNIFGVSPRIKLEKEKNIDREFDLLLKKYEEKFNDQINTESLQISIEQLTKDLKYCLENNIKIDFIYPGINDYNEEEDL